MKRISKGPTLKVPTSYDQVYREWDSYCATVLGAPKNPLFDFREIELNYRDFCNEGSSDRKYLFDWVENGEEPSRYPGFGEPTAPRTTLEALYENRDSREKQVAIWLAASLYQQRRQYGELAIWQEEAIYLLDKLLDKNFPHIDGIWRSQTRYTLPVSSRSCRFGDEIKHIKVPENERRILGLLNHFYNTNHGIPIPVNPDDLIHLSVLEYIAAIENYQMVHFKYSDDAVNRMRLEQIAAVNLIGSVLLGSAIFPESSFATQDLGEYLKGNAEAAKIIGRYQNLEVQLPVSDSERDKLVRSVARKIQEALRSDGKDCPVEVIEDTIYRMPRLNLGPVTIGASVVGIDETQSVAYELEYFLGDNPQLRHELFMRIFMRNFDKFRTPDEARKFLEVLKKGGQDD